MIAKDCVAVATPDVRSWLATRLFLMINAFETGGGERQFVTLVEELRRGGFAPLLGAIERKGPFASSVGEVSEFPLGGSFSNPQAARAGLGLVRHLRKRKVLLAQAFDFYTNLLLIPAARLAGVPVVLGTHWQLGDLLTPWQFRAQLAAFHLSDCVVCNSQAAAETLTGRGLPQRKIAVIPNAIREGFFVEECFSEAVPAGDLNASKAEVRGSFSAEARDSFKVRIGLIARMNSMKKGHQVFLHAARMLASRHSEVEFILAGDGPNRAAFERLATELGIAKSVHFVGDCQDVPALLGSLDLTVNASTSESQSNSILESMACGVPVAASNVGGTPEVIESGETGLLFPPDDVEGLVGAMERFVTQPAWRRQCGERGREFVRRNFRAANVASLYSDMYERLLREKRHP